jgi:hypothetical protein
MNAENAKFRAAEIEKVSAGQSFDFQNIFAK